MPPRPAGEISDELTKASPPHRQQSAGDQAGPIATGRRRRPAVRGAAAVQPVRVPVSHRVPPILVRQFRGDVIESVHRGSIVQASADGTVGCVLGDPDLVVNLRSTVKPFGLIALVEAGGIESFDLSSAELAVMAGSHSGEDLHVRTLQAVFRRSGVSQQLLGCGSEGAPLDVLTSARLARDGEKPGAVRHMCSGQHASLLLLCRLNGWPADEYWLPEHPVQRLYLATVARVFATSPKQIPTSIDSCGLPTYAFPLREVARAFALLADPAGVPQKDPRASLADPLAQIRDAMLANPEMVGGSRDRLDTSVMKAAPGRIISKGGAEGLRGFALLPGGPNKVAASGVALKIEDGGAFDRASHAASIETLRQIGILDGPAARALGRYHRPRGVDPRGNPVAEAVPEFELSPVSELLG